MLLSRASLAFLLLAAVSAASAFATTTTTAPKKTTSHSHSSHSTKSSSKSHKTSKSSHHKLHGQQGIDSARATEIQKALIREHYMTGEANGQWDSATVTAMQKFQADQGWQTKLMPDSRALKKLGLGPDYSDAINANGSSFAEPKPAAEIPAAQASGFASASGVNR
jgi:peptidoglycan hydrolase-like protein with peptidoglycan-binding domain